jgi:hypothetical protein
MIPGHALGNIFARLATLEREVTELCDRVSVLETCTQTYENRLEQLEEWQEQADDKLDGK